MRIITHLIDNQSEIKVRIKREETAFISKFIKIGQENTLSEIGKKPELIMEKLVPEKGNRLIQSLPQVNVEFVIKENLCRCNLEYIGISTHPYIGFILSLPEYIEIEEKRADKIKNITFYATWAMVKVEGSVRHITKIEEGKYKDCYLIGIESPDVIENCRSDST